MVSREEVRVFLIELRVALESGGFYLVNRPENAPHIADLGLKLDTVEEIVGALETRDYSRGPLPDDHGTGEQWWEFGPQVGGEQLYVKVAVTGRKLKCLSVHRAKWPMVLPFK